MGMKKGSLFGWMRNVGLVLFTAMLSACGEEYLQSTINPVTDYGDVSHSLYVQVFWWTMIILVVVWALMAYILVRFREKPGQEKPRQIHGHMGLEVAWTIAPAIIVVAIVIPTIKGVFELQRPPEGDALVVEVTGKRYWWSFHYPELGVTTANELHLPVGRPVSLRLESGDVIHSFWVPQLGGKRDVNPVVAVPEGEKTRYNWMHFTIREEGVFWGQCAEFCGEAHSLMGIRVVAQSEEDFQSWVTNWQTPARTANAPEVVAEAGANGVQGQTPAPTENGGPLPFSGPNAQEGQDASTNQMIPAEDPLVARGREVFFRESTCVLCHAIQGTAAPGVIGPNLTRMGRRTTIAAGMLENTPENLEMWLRDPVGMKPGAEMPGADYPGTIGGITYPATNLNDEQIRALAAYLSSMR
jgi:cytochrome c oxidase subunit 2